MAFMDSAKVEVPYTSEGRNDTAKIEARQMSPTARAFLFTPNSESDGYATVKFAACVTVEERPFQGRVANEVKMGFSPRGPLGVLHRG
jgi:hypothetical protein